MTDRLQWLGGDLGEHHIIKPLNDAVLPPVVILLHTYEIRPLVVHASVSP